MINQINILESFIANLASDIIVGIIIGVVATNYVNNNAARKQKRENLKIAVNLLWSEIKDNKEKLKLFIKYLPNANLPHPGLEVSAWETIDKSLLLEGLKEKDIANLLGIYNRTQTINKSYNALLEKSAWILNKKKPMIKKEFIDKFVDRCKELLDFIEEVIPL